jgi:tRNA pseudouridine38-40 synthase
VVSFLGKKAGAHEQLQLSLNLMLPDDIRVRSMQPVPLDFSARHSAVGKEYHFYCDNNAVHDPVHRLYSQHVHIPLDVAAMR